uniref:UBC core domain-containing protein n=1 Tax=Tetradesmus obliquus TaxID=3088 RepID=A0A383WJT8_TETOB|eukprot:jgi/Sobl393_1/10373/SZX77730.1
MRDLLPAIFSSALPGSEDSNLGSSSNAVVACQQQQGPSSSAPSSWGLSGLKDIIWSNGADNAAGSNAALPSPFASMSGASKQRQDRQAACADKAAAAAVADDATQTDSGAEGDDTDPAAVAAAAAAAAGGDDKSNSSDDDDDSESEWEPEDDDSEDLLDSFQAMLERCWFGSDKQQQQQQQRGELRSFPLPPPSPFQFSTTRTRQLAQRRTQQQAAANCTSALRSTNTQINSKSNTKSNSHDDEDDSWVPSSWLPRPMRRALGRTDSSRASGWHAKPLRVKMAEQVLGEGLVDALELVQRDILESEDPLPEATIKFFVRAGVGVATGWAHKNLNRMFFALGGYVAATCGVMHATKQAAKWAAWKLPYGAGSKAGPAVAFTADVLLPTQFFGPFAATYVVVRTVVKEHRRVLAAAAAVKAAEELGADGKTVTRAAIAAAIDAEPAGDGIDETKAAATAVAAEQQRQQEKKHQQQEQQQQHRLLRMRSLQRSGSIAAAGGGCRSRMRGALRDRARPPAAAAAAPAGDGDGPEKQQQQQQQQQQRPQHVPPQVPVTGTLPSPAPSAVSRQLQVTISQRAVAHVEVLPGLTTVGQLREQVAELLGTDSTQVRLSYAGKELAASLDGSALELAPGVDVLAVMQRVNITVTLEDEQDDTVSDTQWGYLYFMEEAAAAAAAAAAAPTRTRRKQEEEAPASKLAWAAASADVSPDRRRAAAKQVPGSRPGASAQVQLARQFRDLLRHPISGIDAAPSDDDLFTWNVKLAGPEGSPYEGGWFDVKLEFTQGFPGHQPQATFITKFWHPNVHYPGGDVCLVLGGMYEQDVCSVACVLVGLQVLLAHPNPESPVNGECAEQMLQEPQQYHAQAKCWTLRHAT